ncbi:MAG: acyl-CoA dehydrogenase family protein [Candidatus Sericytochromatia bacterium]|nr:acyl-CoA dehydrogenase family protein [Candidatus Sericytochromatia bacterium]
MVLDTAWDALGPEYRLVYEAALEFARAEFGASAAEDDERDHWSDDPWPKLARAGYLGIAIPEAYGGSGGDYLSAALVCQALSRVSPALGLSYGAHLNLVAHNLLRNGTEIQKRRWLPALCSGERIGALGITEPGAGSDAMGITTRADASGADFILHGSKMFVTNGPIADFMIVYTKTEPSAGKRGISAFCLDLPAPGFSVSRKLDKVGMRGSPTGEITFSQTPVPRENLLGELNQGYRVVMSGLDLERAFYAFLAVGVAEEALALGLRYSQEREQFGEKISNFQLIQAKLADMFVAVMSSRLMALEAMRLVLADRRCSKEAAAALLYTSESAQRTVDMALQIHGGYGYCKEYAIQRLWRDARLGTIGAGTSEIRRLIIARELLGVRGR